MKFLRNLGICISALSMLSGTVLAGSASEIQSTSIVQEDSPQHTIKTLSKLSDAELFKLVQDKGISIDCVPNGRSAGKPGYIDKDVIKNSNGTKALFRFMFTVLGPMGTRMAADLIWKGKTFKQSEEDCTKGKGVNRVGFMNLFTLENQLLTSEDFIDDEGRFGDASEQGFIQALQANQNGVNIVELNYSNPRRDPLGAGKRFGIRDIMVPIEGKNGVIFIGRAYTGKWATDSEFKSEGMLAWFFLDFSAAAVRNEGLFGRIW